MYPKSNEREFVRALLALKQRKADTVLKVLRAHKFVVANDPGIQNHPKDCPRTENVLSCGRALRVSTHGFSKTLSISRVDPTNAATATSVLRDVFDGIERIGVDNLEIIETTCGSPAKSSFAAEMSLAALLSPASNSCCTCARERCSTSARPALPHSDTVSRTHSQAVMFADDRTSDNFDCEN